MRDFNVLESFSSTSHYFFLKNFQFVMIYKLYYDDKKNWQCPRHCQSFFYR